MKEIPNHRRTASDTGVARGAFRHILPLAVVLLAPSLARAETGVPYDSCSSTFVKVPATLPANAPGIFLGVGSSAPMDVQLHGSDGSTITTVLEPTPSTVWQTLSFKTPLSEGVTYTLSWNDCAGAGSKSFVATAAKPLPTSAGTLTIGTFSLPAECDSTGRPYGNREATAELVLDPAVEPFAELAVMDVSIDAESAFGGAIYASGGKWVATVIYKCPYAKPVMDAVAHVRIPGAAPIDTPKVAITTMCPAAGEGVCPGEADASVDAATDAAASGAPMAASDKDTGCNLGASRAGASAWMLAGAFVLLYRRRSRALSR